MIKRVFLAINIPDEVKQKLGPIIEELKKSNPDYGIKWVAAENLHLTLHFFGDLNEKQIAAVEEGIWKITERTESFEMKTGNFGCFPNEQSPHVFFASVGNSDAIHTFIGELEVLLQNLGFEVDPRPWRGHLTLGRIKNWSNCKITGAQIPELSFAIKSIELMESELTPDGSVYSIIKSFPLK